MAVVNQNHEPDQIGARPIRILYIYDMPNWAIHNVGKYWLRLLGNQVDFTFADNRHLVGCEPSQYDLIWWGYSKLLFTWFFRFQMHLSAVWNKRTPLANMPPQVTVVHDPSEVYPNRPGWRSARPHYHHLEKYSKVAVTSHTMQELLRRVGYECSLINTNSLLPLRPTSEIKPEGLRVFSRGKITTIRKNLLLASALQQSNRARCESFDLYFGYRVLPVVDYIAHIDSHNCYLCTSWQEGGPLPLMDAMQRGCAVLTTPVGQTDEWVHDGVNGYFCRTRSEFNDRIRYLATHPQILNEMRLASITIAASRSDEMVRAQLVAFINSAVTERRLTL